MRTIRIVSIEPLIWKVLVDAQFPCMLCREKEAIRKVQIQAREATINLCLCEECSGLEPDEIMNRLTDRTAVREAA